MHHVLDIHLKEWAHLGSNQGPPGYEPEALPIELWALIPFRRKVLSSGDLFVKH